MQIKRFEAESVTRALKAVKAELGPDAVILETRKIGFKGGKGVQVTAAYEPPGGEPPRPALATLPAESPTDAPATGVVDPPWAKKATTRAERGPYAPVSAASPAPASSPAAGTLSSTAILEQVSSAIAPLREDLSQVRNRLNTLDDPTDNGEWVSMKNELSTLRTLVNELVVDRRVNDLSDDLQPLYLSLTGKGLPRDTATDLINALPDGDTERLVETIADRIPVAGPLLGRNTRSARILFAGPTGVGKTTTIAKLAAHFAINEKRKVALITLDTFRIGAVEQLTTYADIIGVPSAVAADKIELKARLETFADFDLVLIDTAGRSPRDTAHIQALQALELDGIQVQLVLPATHSLSDLSASLESYRPLSPAALVITKLDEAEQLGATLHTTLSANIPVSYLTNGQRIPEDIHLASGARLATHFLS